MPYEDLFSRQSEAYARFRPGYPPALFAYLAGLAPAREQSWDCATGSGQSALKLAQHFRRVFATDASFEQVRYARSHPSVHYWVGTAEQPAIPSRSLDLITVSQALHWFDLDRFYAEARRTLRPDGVLAVWGYGLIEVSPEVDRLVTLFHDDVLGRFWSPRTRLVIDRYRSIAFPFSEFSPPDFDLAAEWRLEDLLGFLSSWSALHTSIAENGDNPLEEMRPEFEQAWGEPERIRQVHWPFFMRVGRRAEG